VLDTADGPLNIPNSALLASAVGPFDGDPPEETPDVPPGPADDDEAAAVATAAALAEVTDEPERKQNGD
jgi:hypothetical protein